MEAFLLYLLQSGICLSGFYIFFKVLLSNDTFFRLNRHLLLAGTALCLILPLCHIHTTKPLLLSGPANRLESALSDKQHKDLLPGNKKTGITEETSVTWDKCLGIVYLAGCGSCFLLTILSFRRMYQLIKESRRIRKGNETLYLFPYTIPPFSWRNSILLSEEDFRQYPDEILTHERIHLRSHHSEELFFMEMVVIFQWFNPAAWLLKRELRNVHEYEADKGVLDQGIDATQYQLLLVKKAVGLRLYTLANSFNHSKLKKRITMMSKKDQTNGIS